MVLTLSGGLSGLVNVNTAATITNVSVSTLTDGTVVLSEILSGLVNVTKHCCYYY